MLSILSLFLSEHLANPYVLKLIQDNQASFFERNILQYDYQTYPVRFVGKTAMIYGSLLRGVAKKYGIQIDAIIENPVDGLIEYHLKEESLG